MEILTQQIYHYSPRANDYVEKYRIEWTDGTRKLHCHNFRTTGDMIESYIYLKEGKDIDGEPIENAIDKADTVKCFTVLVDRFSNAILKKDEISDLSWSLNEAKTHHSIVC